MGVIDIVQDNGNFYTGQPQACIFTEWKYTIHMYRVVVEYYKINSHTSLETNRGITVL